MDSLPGHCLPACLPEEFGEVALSEKHLKYIIDNKTIILGMSEYSVMSCSLHLKCFMATLQKMPKEHNCQTNEIYINKRNNGVALYAL